MSGNDERKYLFAIVCFALAILALYVAKEVLLPLALAILIAALLAPLVRRIERYGLGRIPSVAIVVCLTFGVFSVLGYVVAAQFLGLSRELPTYKANLIAKVRTLKQSGGPLGLAMQTMSDVGKEFTEPTLAVEPTPDEKMTPSEQLTMSAAPPPPPEVAEALSVKVVEMPPSPLEQLDSWLGPLVDPVMTAGIAMILVVFMLVQYEDLRNRLLRLAGTSRLYATTEAMNDATGRIGRYLRTQFLINAGFGFLLGLGCWVVGVPNAAFWGVLGFTLRFLPYIGPWIAAILPVAVSLAVFDNWTQPLLVVVLLVTLELVVNNIVEPLLYANSSGVSSIGVILAAIFWTWMWGPIGLIMAMPITVCLVVLGRYTRALRFITVMLGDQTSLTMEERIYQRLLARDYEEASKLAVLESKKVPLGDFYDDVLVPVINLAERDRHAGLLNPDQEAFFEISARRLVDTLGELELLEHPENAKTPTSDADAPPPRVLCIPLRDEADETATQMLRQLLSAEGFEVEVGAIEKLTAETIRDVATHNIDAVIISILPPMATRDGRYLCKQLRSHYPGLPIVVGIWSGEELPTISSQLRSDGATEVVTDLREAVNLVRISSPRPPASRGADARGLITADAS